MNNSYTPDDTSAQLYAEETWFQGALLSNIAYGAELTLFVMAFHVLRKKMTDGNRKTHLSLLAFIVVIFILGTLFMAFNSKFAQMAFVQFRNFPGGPSAYEEVDFSNPIDEVANVCFIVGNWLMDALLVGGANLQRFGELTTVFPGMAVLCDLQELQEDDARRRAAPAVPAPHGVCR